MNSQEVGLQRVGPKLYDLISNAHTIKQWDKGPKDRGPSDRYFTDPCQALSTDGLRACPKFVQLSPHHG